MNVFHGASALTAKTRGSHDATGVLAIGDREGRRLLGADDHGECIVPDEGAGHQAFAQQGEPSRLADAERTQDEEHRADHAPVAWWRVKVYRAGPSFHAQRPAATVVARNAFTLASASV